MLQMVRRGKEPGSSLPYLWEVKVGTLAPFLSPCSDGNGFLDWILGRQELETSSCHFIADTLGNHSAICKMGIVIWTSQDYQEDECNVMGNLY